MKEPSAETLESIYRTRFSEADRKTKADIWKVLVERFFQRFVSPEADLVLDLGCGFGEFLNSVRARRRIGVDLNPAAEAYLDPEIEFRAGPVYDLSFLPDASIDLVFTSNVMEHLPGKDEVEAMLRETRRVLRPTGRFLALGPNLRFLPGSYWDFWDHVVPITDRSLVEVLEALKFEILDCWPRFLPYTTRSALPQSPLLVRLYLMMPVAWRIFGKQFLVSARPRPKYGQTAIGGSREP